MSIGPKKFLGVASGIILLFIPVYYACFQYQLGAHVKAEWWLKNVYQYKDHVAGQIESPKIIIISGSNSLFGINSAVIEEITGYRTVNLSGHALLGMDFFYHKIKEHIGRGDIIVMPLEFNYYEQEKMSDWFVNNMLAWGQQDYLNKLTLVDLFKFIISVPKARIYNGVLEQDGTNPILPESKVINALDELLLSEGNRWRGYHYTSLNRYGDMNSGEEATGYILKLYDKGIYYVHEEEISKRFISTYKKINKLVSRYNGKLILTWPVSIRNKYYDLSLPDHQNKTDNMRELLKEKSIKIECNPALFNYDVRFFFDTSYHLNKQGTMIKSENLAHCLNQVIEGKGKQNITYDEAVSRVRSQESRF